MGMSNHEQWHRTQAALAARSNPTAGAPTTSNDGAPTQDDSGNPLPEQDSTRASPGPSGEVADQEPVDEALRQDSSGEADEDPPWQAPTLADTASSPLPETPATPTDQTSPENQLAGMEGPAASGEPSPEPAGSQESGDSQAYATQEEAAGTMGPEDSAWMLREETAELRELRRLPESAGDWARFENIIDPVVRCLITLQGPNSPPERILYYGWVLRPRPFKPSVVYCYSCFKQGHMKSSCPFPPKYDNMEPDPSASFQCGLCQTDDHDITSPTCLMKLKAT
ncbi:hypothetical protein HPB49_017839 [Dermacentor silvarum]|uniref:Uncharacterized protein n=1 Tax=Dermacentor silvarum TaxID=543639 RepID=A0ACB8CGH3_DERSI|nr:hypothetical protein HPB49_017839 [Dermacentor silvarum]